MPSAAFMFYDDSLSVSSPGRWQLSLASLAQITIARRERLDGQCVDFCAVNAVD